VNPFRAASTLRTGPRPLVVSSILVLGTLLIGACTTAPTTPTLPSEAKAIVDSPTYAHGSWRWNAVELGTGKTLYASNENKLNFLGSTTKLFTVGTTGGDAVTGAPPHYICGWVIEAKSDGIKGTPRVHGRAEFGSWSPTAAPRLINGAAARSNRSALDELRENISAACCVPCGTALRVVRDL
jgi:hypothetical protein